MKFIKYFGLFETVETLMDAETMMFAIISDEFHVNSHMNKGIVGLWDCGIVETVRFFQTGLVQWMSGCLECLDVTFFAPDSTAGF